MENDTVRLQDIGAKAAGPENVRPRKKKKGLKVFLLLLLLVAALAAGGLFWFTRWMSGKIDHKEIDRTPDALGISASYQTGGVKEIENIALFGIDARGGDKGRSDATMILTVDRKRHKIKITSLMRDSYVKVDGYGNTKLCHAYYFGGAPLAIKTINQNYNMDIRDYVTVNFDSLAQVIDAVGGVTINVTEEERTNANHSIEEYAQVYNKTPTYIEKSGEQVLNGMQAVGYARIRYVGNGDYQRTERQRDVLEQIFSKALKQNPLGYPKILSTVLPEVETSLTAQDILGIGLSTVRDGSSHIEQMRFPLDSDIDHKHSTINGVSYVVSDMSVTSKKLNDYIFNDVDPTQSK